MIAANSADTTEKKRGKPFRKGQSGNPKGRPKTDPEVKRILKAAAPEAAQALVDIMRSENDDKLRLEAAKTILDRVYGKATQPIEGDVDGFIRVILGGELEDYAK